MNLQTYHVLVSTLYLVKIIVYFSAALFLCVKELVISGVNRITSPYNRALVRIFMPGGPGGPFHFSFLTTKGLRTPQPPSNEGSALLLIQLMRRHGRAIQALFFFFFFQRLRNDFES